MKHVEEHSILCQHDFRARRSCETQLVTLLHDLASTLDKGVQTDMVVLDFSKVFDRVPYGRLLRKLHHCGIRGNTHQWITPFLLGRTQRVVHQTACRSLAGSHKVQCWGPCSSYCLSMTSRTRSSRRLACLPMTVLFIDQSTTTVIAQPCNKTSMLWQSGKPSGAWRSILRSVVF